MPSPAPQDRQEILRLVSGDVDKNTGVWTKLLAHSLIQAPANVIKAASSFLSMVRLLTERPWPQEERYHTCVAPSTKKHVMGFYTLPALGHN